MRWTALRLKAYVHCIKDLGVTIVSNLKFFQQCKECWALKTWNFSFENKDVTLPLNISLARPHLEYAMQFWSPHHHARSYIVAEILPLPRKWET